jgi:chemotaxis protein histidine kinase CheA
VALLGGRCELHSRPGAGTRVVAEVPLSASTMPVHDLAVPSPLVGRGLD